MDKKEEIRKLSAQLIEQITSKAMEHVALALESEELRTEVEKWEPNSEAIVLPKAILKGVLQNTVDGYSAKGTIYKSYVERISSQVSLLTY